MDAYNQNSDSYVGTSAAYENGDGTGSGAKAVPSMTHAWVIIVGALVVLWLLGGVAFRSVRM